MLADLLKKLLYVSGTLGAYHRLRNARTLTVVMFHRVLDPLDPRWAASDPDYTLRADLFAQCLRFFVDHYNVVSADDVLRARRGETSLPSRALLITFDDGWADNVDFAVPQLRKLGLPSLMFVVSDAVDRNESFFQERILGAWRRGTLTLEQLNAALRQLGAEAPVGSRNDAAQLRQSIQVVEALGSEQRARLLETLSSALADPLRQMITTQELRTLDEAGVAIGLHGKTHIPMTRAPDLDAELAGARNEMSARMPYRTPPQTMSFPHGRYDAPIAAQARQAGYELVFTSVPTINPVRASVDWLLGRLGFETDAVADAQGRFRPEWLALYLFRRPHRAPT
ncbi:MAG: polysaccharide deacetylase family protein [Burkholderiales bacterium]|nr:polysaccharide deacetylase family protein [Burkholderiales bacterium]